MTGVGVEPGPALTPVTLEGRVVRLEPLASPHLDALVSVALEPELWRLAPNALANRHDLERYVSEALAWQQEGTSLPFVQMAREGGAVAGMTRLANYVREHRRVEIGWTWLAQPFRGTLVNTEAKYLLLRHAFETVGCWRVELKTDSLNARSRRAITRLGAVEEGTFRNHMITEGGRPRHTVWFSIVADEWPAVATRLRARLDAGERRQTAP